MGWCNNNFVEIRDFLEKIILEAGEIALDYFKKGVTYKTKSHLADLVTEADKGVSDFLIQKIQAMFPDHHIRSEELENDINPGADYEWVIDPIDGTRNFAMGIPMWCIIIAVVYRGETLYGAVYNPIAHELFLAEKGQGATLNKLPIKVSAKDDMYYACGSLSCVAEANETYGSHVDRFVKLYDNFNHKTVTWRHAFGCMLATCYVATGGMDFFVQNAGLDHDFLGPVLIAREAGAVVTDSDGNEWQRGRQDIVIAPPALHPKIMELFD